KGGGQWLPAMSQIGADALGLDWTTPLDQARQTVAGRVALQGNLDPNTLYGSPARIRQAVKAMLADAYADGVSTGYVANLGHGITQWVDPMNAGVFVDAVHEFSADYFG
ncbi:MAG: uroporphyrinogen decarboxylase family protein, partial [Pseudomonadota bacterium]|nr:uroporphyrinogen decarboxylase family protein [Pseudomonadota bacterium]